MTCLCGHEEAVPDEEELGIHSFKCPVCGKRNSVEVVLCIGPRYKMPAGCGSLGRERLGALDRHFIDARYQGDARETTGAE